MRCLAAASRVRENISQGTILTDLPRQVRAKPRLAERLILRQIPQFLIASSHRFGSATFVPHGVKARVVCHSRYYHYLRTLPTVTAKSHARYPAAATLSDLVDGAISRGGETGRTAGALRSQFHGPVSGQCPRPPASKRRARMRAGSSNYRDTVAILGRIP
jgi:hypothetical protein